MPLNRAALIGISTNYKCLQNHYRRWTFNDLIDGCTEALAKYESRSNPVSQRTFQNALALMRSDRHGYNAPIVVRDNKYYELLLSDQSLISQQSMARSLNSRCSSHLFSIFLVKILLDKVTNTNQLIKELLRGSCRGRYSSRVSCGTSRKKGKRRSGGRPCKERGSHGSDSAEHVIVRSHVVVTHELVA